MIQNTNLPRFSKGCKKWMMFGVPIYTPSLRVHLPAIFFQDAGYLATYSANDLQKPLGISYLVGRMKFSGSPGFFEALEDLHGSYRHHPFREEKL